jgi:uncharacterized protein (TIGR03083 family)
MDTPDTPEYLAAWLAAGVAPLVTEMSVDPATEVWTFANEKTVGWWGRRQLHETVVHRADAELALDREPVVDTEIAIDGIDELICGLLPYTGAPAKLVESGHGGQSVHFHTTDGAGEWTVVLTDGGFTVTAAHQKSTAAVRGTATDLLLLLWNRRPLSDTARYECFGDTALIDAWLAATVI